MTDYSTPEGREKALADAWAKAEDYLSSLQSEVRAVAGRLGKGAESMNTLGHLALARDLREWASRLLAAVGEESDEE